MLEISHKEASKTKENSYHPRLMSEFYSNEIRYLVIAIEEFIENRSLPEYLQEFLLHYLNIRNYSEVDRFSLHDHLCIILETSADQTVTNEIASLLTPRELQIATQVALGQSNKQIAKKLKISAWTVATHLRRIFAKLQCDSRSAMVYRCAPLIQDLQRLKK